MRIKYTAIPNVVNGNPAPPVTSWAAPGGKQEMPKQTEPDKKDKKKRDRSLDWLRRGK